MTQLLACIVALPQLVAGLAIASFRVQQPLRQVGGDKDVGVSMLYGICWCLTSKMIQDRELDIGQQEESDVRKCLFSLKLIMYVLGGRGGQCFQSRRIQLNYVSLRSH